MRTSSRRNDGNYVEDENPYWISFSDIMAGLLVIFILASIALILELTEKSEKWDKAISEIAKAEQIRKDILTEVEQELRAKNIPVRISDNDTVLRIPEDVLTFKSSRSNVPEDPRLRQVTLEIGKVLYSSITKDERWKYLDTIFIEGHTDSDPYWNPTIKGNWGLSTFRAISIWEYWNQSMARGLRLDELNNHLGKKLFSVSGYAETRPIPCVNTSVESEETDECSLAFLKSDDYLKRNRRIDIRFTVRRPALEDYEAVKETLE